jgi:hypothetical protein
VLQNDATLETLGRRKVGLALVEGGGEEGVAKHVLKQGGGDKVEKGSSYTSDKNLLSFCSRKVLVYFVARYKKSLQNTSILTLVNARTLVQVRD